ncbi:23S rRNA (guanosine(2251)-2'-O)-methyltransferase RlmB [Desulfohalobium retbaense]|uniref:RNA methyltransferase, TrmH family, group 3 n=1 Tax=Desulfohalobium retbaense (strain ATCC 49708 / DSM 5692 / JCM 16813 / HR100) TaxID=485915 RepID=C8WZB3_DESRD|nr:23S rRNA (guanosine(2251)-2'-O)-methyltransferase RlmB [Desulfohalobium retbaense]ACV67388.1 RNA methyltransferase, TrmH family, group 3 [Desulfohalobium retbaense DSM 5692]
MTEYSHVVAGLHPVKELLERTPDRVETVLLQKGGRQQKEIKDLCQATGIRFQILPRAQLDKLISAHHQGIAARVFSPGFVDPQVLLETVADAPLPLLIALDQVQDPGNIGTLARTLYSLGGAGLVLPKNRSAPLGGGALKASSGALNYLPVAQVTNLGRFLEQATQAALPVIGTGLTPDSLSVYKARLSTPAVLVLGNEHKGMRPGVAKKCETVVSIPLQRQFDSLNVAQAGAILISEFLRQRG